MAFVQDDDNEQQDSQSDKSQSQTDPTVSLGGSSAGVASPGGGNVGGNNQQVPTQQKSANANGSWVNLQDYLSANTDQAAQAGSQIANTVGGQAQKSQDEIDNAGKDFSSQVDSNTVKEDDEGVNNAISKATSLKAGDSFDPSLADNFQKQANATYNGPTDFTQSAGYTQAQNDFNTAKTQLDQTKSEAGRDVLLNNQYSGASENGYNQGEKTLDQALIEGSPQARSAIEGVRNQWAGIQNTLGNQTTAQNAYAQNAAASTAQTSAAAKAALDKANTGFQGGVNTTYQNALTQSNDQLASMQSALKNNSFTPEQMQALGLGEGHHLYGVNLNNPSYIQAGTDPTLYNSASADQYAEAKALAQLAGQSDSTFLPSAYASQVGTARPASFNANALQTDIGNAQAGLPDLALKYLRHASGQDYTVPPLPNTYVPTNGPTNNANDPYINLTGYISNANDRLRNYNDILSGNVMRDPYDPIISPNQSEWQSIQDLLQSNLNNVQLNPRQSPTRIFR